MTAVSVTERHLAEGIPGDPRACPVVLAVADAFPRAQDVSVGEWYVHMYHAGRSELLAIPESVRALIAAIDRRRPVEPFTFDLDYPAVTA